MSDVSRGSAGSIAILLPDLRPGGAERLHITLAQEWLEQGCKVEFVLRRVRGDLLKMLPTTIRVVDLESKRVRQSLVPLVRYLRIAQPDVLLAAMWPLTVLAPLAARLAGYRGRVVVSEHSPLSRAYASRGGMHRMAMRGSMKLGYPLADARVAVSHGVADDLARLSRLPREEFEVIHNPAALGRDMHALLPRPKPIEGLIGPVILTVGTLKSVKRHDLLLEAFAQMSTELGATLCILGEGKERVALEGEISRLGLSGRVLLPGFVSDPAPWYAHSDLFVLSSDYEGFGNVIVEAMEHGLPIVSTDCPAGPGEILCGGLYGILVPVGDASALSHAMRRALDAPVDGEALRQRARDFSADKIAQRYLDVLLPGRHGPRDA